MPNDQSASIARAAVKAPPFWRANPALLDYGIPRPWAGDESIVRIVLREANPALWFRQMESQFTLAGVTSEIKVPPHRGCFGSKGVGSRWRHYVESAGRRAI
ncbi:hypothetical protein AVEN_51994-1 [Araneus ventricosus]|uniref:Uncharacterized protein n=1 Tax=Araneus ventricosus TaxID=182803 RepID=A0A4Y2CF11_ARAVE|nr:hypothetical protein AVEN_51994-1 [Araneus ventricosus]